MTGRLAPTFQEVGAMRKPQLMGLYSRMMRERGSVSVLGGPRTAEDYRSAILCMVREDEVRAGHLAEAGPGHERCPTMNFEPACGWVRS